MSALADNAIRLARNSTALPWVMLGIGTAMSVILYAVIRDNIETAAEERFDHQTIETGHVIERRIVSYAEILYGAKALFSAHDSVTRLQFHRYVQSLDLKSRFPGFDVLNYAAYVPAEKRRQFIDSVRHDVSLVPQGYPRFAIKPPGDRPEYFVIAYVEPMTGFDFAFGIDLGANPEVDHPNALAITQRSARDTGQLSASGLPIRIKAEKEYIGLAMRLPVYRNGMPVDTVEQRRAAYLGSVGAGFNVANMMKTIIDEKVTRYLRFRIYGPTRERGTSNVSSSLLFDSIRLIQNPSLQSSMADRADAAFSRILTIDIARRSWQIHFSSPKNAFIDPLDRAFPPIALVGGLLSSFLLFGVLYSLSSSRSRAVGVAAQITREFRESEDRLRAVSGRLVEVQEAERRLLATELHDRVGQNLTALGLNLRLVAGGASGGVKPEAVARLQDCEVLLKATVDAIRNVMGELRPQVLDDYGLLAALRSHASGFSKRTGIAVSIDGGGVPGGLPKSVDAAMYRIAQEALNNVAKHSRASRVEIALLRTNGHARLSIRDDGVGFDPERVVASNPDAGWGLLIMRERAEAVGAKLKLDANPGSGVRVLVEYRI